MLQGCDRLDAIYIIAVEGNTVRIAIGAPADIRITRVELLPEDAQARWIEDGQGPIPRRRRPGPTSGPTTRQTAKRRNHPR